VTTANAIERIYGDDAAEVLQAAWLDACHFAREHRATIVRLGDWLGRAGTVSGTAIRIHLDRLRALPENSPESATDPDEDFIARPKKKRKTKLAAAEDSEEQEEPADEDLGLDDDEIDEDENTYTDASKQTKKAGRIGSEGFYRTDGYISPAGMLSGGTPMMDDWEPGPELYQRAVDFWAHGIA
jgi:hypothetical protein